MSGENVFKCRFAFLFMVDVKLSKKEETVVEKEVEKRLRHRVYVRTRDAAMRFKKEFQKHVLTAVSAALGFLIALSWRQPIQNSVNSLIESVGLSDKLIFYEYISAVIITLIAVLILMAVSRWSVKKE